MKYLVVLAFIAILVSLASALFFMMRGGKDAGADKAKARCLRIDPDFPGFK